MIPPKNFKMLTILLYDGKTDPVAHVQKYRTWINIAKADAATLCNAFPLTLSRPAQAWFGRLRAGTITSFEQLKEQFIAQFLSSRPQNRVSNYLKTFRQKDGETIREYLFFSAQWYHKKAYCQSSRKGSSRASSFTKFREKCRRHMSN